MMGDPKQIIDLHEQAMEWADQARAARRAGDDAAFDSFMLKAFELEKRAALLIKNESSEPTRSVLHRSAASLAFRCKKYREAEWLISRALAGNPPEDIIGELRRLSRKVNFQLSIQEKEVSLSDREFSMKLTGNEISEGMVPVGLIAPRITKLKKIFWNTIRWINGIRFGSSSRAQDQKYTLWVSALAPGSIDVILKLGAHSQLILPDSGAFDSILDKVMTNFQLLNNGEYAQLEERINDKEYYRNFFALAKEIAPDGDDVETVRFGAFVEGQQRRVNFVRRQHELEDVPLPDLLDSANGLRTTEDVITVRGKLQFADSMTQDKLVKLRDQDSGSTWEILVPEALMKDVVQPYFDEEVEIVGKRMARERMLRTKLYFKDIRRATP